LDSIDETINPCEDFYHFACGTWFKNARIPEDSMFIFCFVFLIKKILKSFLLAGVQNIFNLLDTQLDSNLIGTI
jgi:predicted metalloendopeptidase